MKTGSIVAAALVAISTPYLVAAETCSTMTLVFKLLPLLGDANTCADETGYKIYPFTGKPTEEQMTAICANPTCVGVLEDCMDKNLPDYTIDFEATQLNVRTKLTGYASKCGVATERK